MNYPWGIDLIFPLWALPRFSDKADKRAWSLLAVWAAATLPLVAAVSQSTSLSELCKHMWTLGRRAHGAAKLWSMLITGLQLLQKQQRQKKEERCSNIQLSGEATEARSSICNWWKIIPVWRFSRSGKTVLRFAILIWSLLKKGKEDEELWFSMWCLFITCGDGWKTKVISLLFPVL